MTPPGPLLCDDPPGSRGPLIIIGASARAAAQSAIRAGYSPWCIDLFADRDLRAIAPVKQCPRYQWPHGVLELVKDAPPGPVMFTGAMENHLEVVRSLSETRPILGSPPDAMAAARDPARLAKLRLNTKRHRAAYPRTYAPSWARRLALVAEWGLLGWTGRGQWLLKPRRSGGGGGVQRWRPWQHAPAGHLVQQFVKGQSFSAVYAGVEDDCRLMAMHYQIIGQSAFGAIEFQYVGNRAPMILPPYLKQGIVDVGRALCAELHLRGLFGVDFVANGTSDSFHSRDIPWFVEVNPRYTASVELIERSFPIAAMHLTPPTNEEWDRLDRVCGKAIVYAKGRCEVPDLLQDFSSQNIADVPQIGAIIEKGQPICTVFYRGENAIDCDDGLRAMAEKVYTRLVPA